MPKIKFFVISCSSDALDIDARRLYVWGELDFIRWLPQTEAEAKKRIAECQKKKRCEVCDAEIHNCTITRTKKIKKYLA